MTLYATVLWLYGVMTSIVFGASVYESVVVHPAWSREPPESLVGVVGARMNFPLFWKPVAPLYALSGLGALALASRAGSPPMPLAVSAACAVTVVVWTLVYFRRTITRYLETGGGNVPAERLQSEVRRWVRLNWIRLAMVAVSWAGALAANGASR